MQTVKCIPIGLAEWTLRNKKSKELALLICLKNNSHGIFNNDLLEDLFAKSQIKTKKTFELRINSLIKLRWITYNDKTGWYKIKSFYLISELMGCLSKRIMEIVKLDYMQNFQEFLFAGVLSYYTSKARYYYNKNEAGRKIANMKGLGFEFFDSERKKMQRFFGISMDNIAKRLKISRQRANKLKLLAKKKNFITSINRVKFLRTVTPNECKNKRFLNLDGFTLFKKGRDKIIRAYRVMPDEIISDIKIKKSKLLIKNYSLDKDVRFKNWIKPANLVDDLLFVA